MRFLFSSTPGDGHVRPLLGLARALRGRGHEVVFATAAAWAPKLEEEGFEVLPAGIGHAEARAAIPFEESRRLGPREVRLFLFPRIFAAGHAPAKLPDLLTHAAEWRAEAIVYESADLAAPLAAAALGLPSVNHSFGVMVPLAVLERAAEMISPLWREHGLEPDPHAGAFRGLYVDVSPPSFALEAPLGPAVGLRSASRGNTSGGERLVYATMGTIWNEPAYFRVLLDALAGRQALVTTGHGVDPASLEPVPPGIRVERFVPQEEVLPQARAVVSHGGSGTMLGALAHGLPLVLLPQGADQFDNAEACRRAGVGIVLSPHEVAAASVRAAVEQVIDEPEYAAAAARVADEIAAMPSLERVAGAVEEHAARR